MEERSQVRKSKYNKYEEITELIWIFLDAAEWCSCAGECPYSWEMHAELFRSGTS